MTISRFVVFTTVLELRSFTKAATKLNMTQSAVSHAVSSLESEWGATLLIRDRKKGLLLTELGQKTVVHMREILNRIEQINQELAFASKLEAGTIRLGTFYSASACLLPKILARFQKKYPNIEFLFFEGTYGEVVDWLETGIIDIGFIIESSASKTFEMLSLVKDEMVVALPHGHRLGKRKMIEIEDIKEEPLIMPKGMYEPYILEIFKKAEIDPVVRFEVQDCTTIANMVQEGLGITIGPKLFLKTQRQLQLVHLAIENLRDVSLAYIAKPLVSPAVQAFLTEAGQIFNQKDGAPTIQ
ncbi:LysR family transcriptional regulator [Viridibacillus arvi]|uniref:LysR family transcriptional regulator n=1 Tax=Viridibacillus arvi TaxID=263475 RepID=UPI003D2D8D3A